MVVWMRLFIECLVIGGVVGVFMLGMGELFIGIFFCSDVCRGVG